MWLKWVNFMFCNSLSLTLWDPVDWSLPVPLSMEFSRQDYWSGLPFPTLGTSRSRDWTCLPCISCVGRQILYHCSIHNSNSYLNEALNIRCRLSPPQFPTCNSLFFYNCSIVTSLTVLFTILLWQVHVCVYMDLCVSSLCVF